MYSRLSKSLSRVLVLSIAAALPCVLAAQDAPKPAAKAATADAPSKWDIFVGYSYLSPHATINNYSFQPVDWGSAASITRYFNKHLGVQIEGNTHVESQDWTPNTSSTNTNDDFGSISGGVIYRFPQGNVTPFVHALMGAERIGGIYFIDHWGPMATLGGGLDYETPWLKHRLALRVFQADYQWVHEDFGYEGKGSFNDIQLSAGVVFHIVPRPVPPLTLACAVPPGPYAPGDPATVVTATATPAGGDPKLTPIISWSGIAGVSGTGTTVTAKGPFEPGTYTFHCSAKEGKPGKEGLKPGESAEASTSFTVRPYEQPTVSCTASPVTIHSHDSCPYRAQYPDETSSVSATAISSDHRPLTIAYSATGGTVSGSGGTATFTPSGPGTATITCSVTDDKGGSASSTATITSIDWGNCVEPVKVEPQCPSTPITFGAEKGKAGNPARVNNEAKACLDTLTDSLKNDSRAHVVVVGEETAKERAAEEKTKFAKKATAKNGTLAAQRAQNTEDYLVTSAQAGIDADRIYVRTGDEDAAKVETYLLPKDAKLSDFEAKYPGTTAVAGKVKVTSRKAIPIPGTKPTHKKHHPVVGNPSLKPPQAAAPAKK